MAVDLDAIFLEECVASIVLEAPVYYMLKLAMCGRERIRCDLPKDIEIVCVSCVPTDTEIKVRVFLRSAEFEIVGALGVPKLASGYVRISDKQRQQAYDENSRFREQAWGNTDEITGKDNWTILDYHSVI